MEPIITPMSPMHPAPNEEINPLSLPTTQLENNDIDLNPDLYDDDDKSPPSTLQNNANLAEEELKDHNEAMRELEQSKQFSNADIYKLHQVTLPFTESYRLFTAKFDSFPPVYTSPITSDQQSKLIRYLDEQLLQIQRKFVKQQAETTVSYSCPRLIQDLDSVIDLLWVSIAQKQRLFGQEEYYIKILGDLEDYINHYKTLFDELWINSNVRDKFLDLDRKKMIAFFKFIQKLDLQLSLLIDGYDKLGKVHVAEEKNDGDISITNNNGRGVAIARNLQKFSATELVRLFPIISRLRLAIIEKIDSLRKKVTDESIRDVLELEVSRIFEGVLERSC
ncbi:hypothetical protein KGF56_000984 [Candida oxycetoniae]|uniref:Uncharacterized protein n=1 Tax=Candida oxycetoniae TaxID=497107 RepID=A0AAI9WZ96_9ASCO|nr:uncharacterized protein KGF56_000984 [Candida oxycetoniae]KAI3406142.2 hypothetical protein KGF56_000984 [Candida oxycetoniae]